MDDQSDGSSSEDDCSRPVPPTATQYSPQQAAAIHSKVQELMQRHAEKQMNDFALSEAIKLLTRLSMEPHEYEEIKAFLRMIVAAQTDLEVLQLVDNLEDEVIRRRVRKIRAAGEKLYAERGDQWLQTDPKARDMVQEVHKWEAELQDVSKKIVNTVDEGNRGKEAKVLKHIVKFMILEIEDEQRRIEDELEEERENARLERLTQPMPHLEEVIISTLQILSGQSECDSPSRDLVALYRATIPDQRQHFKQLVFSEGRRLEERLRCIQEGRMTFEDTAKAVLASFRAAWKAAAEMFSGVAEDPVDEFGDLPQIPTMGGYHEVIQQMIQAMTAIVHQMNAAEQQS